MPRPGCRSASRCVRSSPWSPTTRRARRRFAPAVSRCGCARRACSAATRSSSRRSSRRLRQPWGPPFHRCLLELEAARSQPVDRALAAFERVLAENLTRERPGLTLHAAARAANAALALGDLERAGRHLAAARALPETCAPFDIDRSELWLLVARVMQATGDVAGAWGLIGRSAQWVRSTAAQLPAEWRDAFLRRHPANAGLLAAAAALPQG